MCSQFWSKLKHLSIRPSKDKHSCTQEGIKIASYRGKEARGVAKALETDGLVGNNIKDKNGSYGN